MLMKLWKGSKNSYVISETSLTLIKKILVRDVDERPTITDIMEDEWLQI